MRIKLYYYRVPSGRMMATVKKGAPPPIKKLIAGPSYWPFHPKGGVTKAVIEDNEGYFQAIGYAYCSMSDNFCRKTGRDLATSRALKQLEEANHEEETGATS